ncbi:hypothetical protein ACLOAU_16145 [Niabella sp. CJ426]|uniref:hypothetical protein n=1 Tax=Niabella sp. CJ426 TaxID=3393740 RepID=UPI003CFFE674
MEEVCVDIMIPANRSIPGLAFKRKVIQWHGQLYPQDLVQAQYEYFKLTMGPLPFFVPSTLPGDLQEQQWQCISIEYDDDKLPDHLASPADIFGERSIFFELVTKLIKEVDKWVIVFTPDCNDPEEKGGGNLEAALKKIKESFNKRKGFIMYHDKTSVL